MRKTARNLTYLFVSHDLAVLQMLCDTALVMRSGKCV
jgi:ABC-type microcin C transport system duplicated ATPase subunit YejF